MIWIELIGPSGIGKSYWYQKFMDKYPEFEPRQMLLNRIYQSSDYDNLSWRHKLMFKIFKMNIYRLSNHMKHRLFNLLLEDFQRKSKLIFTEKDDGIIIKKNLKSRNLLSEPQIVVLEKISYFHKKLLTFKFYQYYLDKNDIYIAEDGLIHLTRVFIEELKADKILIFEKEYKTILKQRLQRAKTRPTTFIEFLLEEEDLKNYIQDYYQLYRNKIKTINQHVPSANLKTINLDEQNVLKEMYETVIGFNK